MAPRQKKKGGTRKKKAATGPAGETVSELLAAVGVADIASSLSGCANLDAEWKIIKSYYRVTCLAAHPDKGGDAATFRKVRSSFETLRGMFEKRALDSFQESQARSTKADFQRNWDASKDSYTPSYAFYEAAAEVEVPFYKVELAKSDRSACMKYGTLNHEFKDKKCPIDGDTKYKNTTKYYKSLDKDQSDGFVTISMTLIKKGMVRIGMVDDQTFTYGRWCHLECWRVPYKVWSALPGQEDPRSKDPAVIDLLLRGMNEVLLTGIFELPDEDRMRLVRHVMDPSNWARAPKKELMPKPSAEAPAPPSGARGDAPAGTSGGGGGGGFALPGIGGVDVKGLASKILAAVGGGPSPESQAVVPKKEKFKIPVPGQGLAKAGCMDGLTCVLTGIFPEVGGGGGLNLGKDRTKKMVESFGGRVTSAVSGVTDLLIVGKEPGMSKVTKARNQPKCTLIDLKQLADGLAENTVPLAIEKARATDMKIDPDAFSAGYGLKSGYNSLAYRSSQEAIDFAAGLTAGTPALAPKKAAKKKKPAATKAKGKGKATAAPKAKASGGVKRKAEGPAEGAAAADLTKKKVVELKDMLKMRGLPTHGKKAELVQRLSEAASCNFL